MVFSKGVLGLAFRFAFGTLQLHTTPCDVNSFQSVGYLAS